nr:TMV resistance protein N-like [Ipomoea batatas]
MMERIGASVGSFLFFDSATEKKSRPSVARMRVEVDVCRPLLNKIWIAIGSKGDGFWQYIEYEQMPRFCSNCARFGHMRNDCWNLSDKGRRLGKAPAVYPKRRIEKDVGLVKNGQSEKQASSGFESFIVDKKAWEEARQELYGFFTQNSMKGMQAAAVVALLQSARSCRLLQCSELELEWIKKDNAE